MFTAFYIFNIIRRTGMYTQNLVTFFVVPIRLITAALQNITLNPLKSITDG